MLTQRYKSTFDQDFVFEPEGITEGGILFRDWPGKKDREYKSMRLNIENYPFIVGGQVPQGIYLRFRPGSSTFLKALYGAPTWTVEELRIWTECFAEMGIQCFKTPIITQKKLNDYDFY